MIAFTWACIAACFALYVVHPTLWSVLLVWPVMSGRHLGLAILMHDAAHGLLLRNKRWNDRIGQWLTAYPTMADTLLYRRVHFQHHRHTWTDQDPDLGLATALPVSRASFRRKMIRDLTGRTAFARAVLFAASCAAGRPDAYLWIWVLPAWTGYQVVLRIRSIAEHACVSDPRDPLKQTRTTLAPGWLRFFIAPHHVNYHLEHHLFMTVPHYNLPAAHRLLRDAGTLEHAEVKHSYLDVLRVATAAPESAGAAE